MYACRRNSVLRKCVFVFLVTQLHPLALLDWPSVPKPDDKGNGEYHNTQNNLVGLHNSSFGLVLFCLHPTSLCALVKLEKQRGLYKNVH